MVGVKISNAFILAGKCRGVNMLIFASGQQCTIMHMMYLIHSIRSRICQFMPSTEGYQRKYGVFHNVVDPDLTHSA